MNSLAEACGSNVPRETTGKLQRFLDMLIAENEHQNLIGRTTVDDAWVRHIVDSAQLLRFSGAPKSCVDVGSGAGLPGIVLAILSDVPIFLVEPRRLRAEFLQRCVDDLSLSNAVVMQSKVEQVTRTFDLITARAVAPIRSLFLIAGHLAHDETRWILPKGRAAAKELADAKASWQGRFQLEQSVTAHDASIVIAEGVAPRSGRRGRG